jgi:hypothetical protein
MIAATTSSPTMIAAAATLRFVAGRFVTGAPSNQTV